MRTNIGFDRLVTDVGEIPPELFPINNNDQILVAWNKSLLEDIEAYLIFVTDTTEMSV